MILMKNICLSMMILKAEPHIRKVNNINPYLVEGKDLIITKRKKPICNVPNNAMGK